uniref:Putative transposon ty3-i gag-pol polyprotein n=1 Tax=Ixodes ricinus TaxID=34613 RepID=A0A6B0U174_IXORI
MSFLCSCLPASLACYPRGLGQTSTPVEAGPACIEDDDDGCFLGALDVSDMAALQRDDPQLRALIKHLEGQARAVPRAFL